MISVSRSKQISSSDISDGDSDTYTSVVGLNSTLIHVSISRFAWMF